MRLMTVKVQSHADNGDVVVTSAGKARFCHQLAASRLFCQPMRAGKLVKT
jgi:hypothetical protein